MSIVYLAGPTPGTPFINGIYTRATVALELNGHQVINPSDPLPDCLPSQLRRASIAMIALHAETICTLHGADPTIIKAANLMNIPVQTLHQLTTRTGATR